MKQKLLLVADTYYPKVDGTLKFMEEFVARAKKTFDISLLIPRFTESKKGQKLDVESATTLEVSKVWKLSTYPSIKLSRKNRKKIKRQVEKADVVFIQGPAVISHLAIYYAHKLKKNVYYYMHVIPWELIEKFAPPLSKRLFYGIAKKIAIKFYNWCDALLVPYTQLRQKLWKDGVKARMPVAKLGVDIKKFSPASDKAPFKKKLKIDPAKKVIGYVGRISKEKNVETLLNAFNKLQGDYHLLIVGDGQANIKQKFLDQKNCTVTGFVDNVYDYLKAMDVFVMPSLTETTSLATLEAMSCRLPVIVSKVGFMKRYIKRNYNGVFFPAKSPGVLAAKIRKILHDEEFSELIAANARRTVAYSFSWERSINRIKKLLMRKEGDV